MVQDLKYFGTELKKMECKILKIEIGRFNMLPFFK